MMLGGIEMNAMVTIFLSLAMLLGGTAPQPDPQPAASGRAVAHEVVTGPYPQEVAQALQDVRKNGGQTAVQVQDTVYIVIGLGQRPTGGYSLALKQIERTPDGVLKVKVAEQKPAAGALTTQAITYPTIVIALPNMTTIPQYQVMM
jgi:hypothetical protein